jgi:hypothetical protein
MTLGVEESQLGTMTKEEEQAKAASEAKVKTPKEASKVSPDEDLKIFTQKQADALADAKVHAVQSEAGRQVKEIGQERDALKSQIQTKDAELLSNADDIKSLEEKLDDMSKDDPARFDAVKELKAARDERRQLKTKLTSLDDRETNLGEREKKVNSFELEVLIESIADEYEDGDATKLKTAVSVFENPTDEQIRTIANIFWEKKAGGEGKKPKSLKPYSGKSEGGSGSLEGLSRKQLYTKAYSK